MSQTAVVKLLLAQKADLIKNKQDMHVKMWHASCRAPAVNMASHGLESDEMQDAPEHLISSQAEAHCVSIMGSQC